MISGFFLIISHRSNTYVHGQVISLWTPNRRVCGSVLTTWWNIMILMHLKYFDINTSLKPIKSQEIYWYKWKIWNVLLKLDAEKLSQYKSWKFRVTGSTVFDISYETQEKAQIIYFHERESEREKRGTQWKNIWVREQSFVVFLFS